ncbi:hypothetical protein ['Camptotheca acuminata' phytoplasma]|uniref:hypothetical protein n=1 Tax='Camptotheca acuminata' phytoplasma TaxID=3239192 RepID=UPI003519FE6E
MTLAKKIVLFVWSLMLLAIGIVSFILIKQSRDDKQLEKITMVTALPDVKNFLTLNKVKEALNKERIELDVQFSGGDFSKNHERVQDGTVDAKLDSHLPWSTFQSLRQKPNATPNIEVIMPLYFTQFGMYKLNRNNLEYNNLADRLIKMLIPREETQKTLALRFLEKENLITRKPERTDLNLVIQPNGKKRLFQLTLDDFTINSTNLQIDDTSDILNDEMITRLRKSRNEPLYADIMLNYPGVVRSKVGQSLDELNVLKKMDLPEDQNDPIWVFLISLIVKKDKVNESKIQKLKKVLSKPEILQSYWNEHRENTIGFKPNELQQITDKINSYFV